MRTDIESADRFESTLDGHELILRFELVDAGRYRLELPPLPGFVLF